MEKIKIIDISKLLCSQSAKTQEEGQLLYNKIIETLDKTGVTIVLDWTNITSITPTFLNVAIGQLYADANRALLISKRLKSKKIPSEYLGLLKQVIENAKRYFEKLKKRENN